MAFYAKVWWSMGNLFSYHIMIHSISITSITCISMSTMKIRGRFCVCINFSSIHSTDNLPCAPYGVFIIDWWIYYLPKRLDRFKFHVFQNIYSEPKASAPYGMIYTRKKLFTRDIRQLINTIKYSLKCLHLVGNTMIWYWFYRDIGAMFVEVKCVLLCDT